MRFPSRSLSPLLVAAVLALIGVSTRVAGAEQPIDPDSPEFEIRKAQLAKEFVRSPERAAEIKRLEQAYPDQGSPIKYRASGHQYATYIVAWAANLGKERSHELAYFSQFPDDEIQFSATLAFFYLFDLDYRKQIMAVLHSLHGGGQAAVLKRRRDLQTLVQEGVRGGQLKDHELGLIIHAFADSYGHTKGHGSTLKAFNYVWGHLFHGDAPDLIDHDPSNFKAYTCSLYVALSSKGDCQQALADLHKIIDQLRFSRNDALPRFKRYAMGKAGFDPALYAALDKTWKNKIGRDDVKKTIELIESRIDATRSPR